MIIIYIFFFSQLNTLYITMSLYINNNFRFPETERLFSVIPTSTEPDDDHHHLDDHHNKNLNTSFILHFILGSFFIFIPIYFFFVNSFGNDRDNSMRSMSFVSFCHVCCRHYSSRFGCRLQICATAIAY